MHFVACTRTIRQGRDGLRRTWPHDGFLELEKEGFSTRSAVAETLAQGWAQSAISSYKRETKSGAPHWHILLHESDPLKPIRESELSGSWGLGFDSYRLVRNARGAGYVSKYLSKELSAREGVSGLWRFSNRTDRLRRWPDCVRARERSESGQERKSTRERGNESGAYRVSEIAGGLPRKEKLRF